MAIDESEKLLTLTEAGLAWGVAADTIRGWIGKGILRGVRTPGGHWRVKVADLRAALGREDET